MAPKISQAIGWIQQHSSRAVTRFNATEVGKMLRRYGRYQGGLLAGGIAYKSITSIAAGLVLVASIAVLLVGTIGSWQEHLLQVLGSWLPGLVGDEAGEGLINSSSLAVTPATGLVGVISLITLINTALGYIGALRSGVAAMLGTEANLLASKTRELVALIGIGLSVFLGALLQIAGAYLGDQIAALTNLALSASFPAVLGGLVFDSLWAWLAYRVLGRYGGKASHLLPVVLTVAAVIGALRLASSAVVGAAAANPLLAPVAAIITILVFVELVTRVQLYGAAYLGREN